MTSDQFTDKVALVTGAGAGIGRAIATEFARRGGFAIVTDRDGAQAGEVAAVIAQEGGKALALTLDVMELGQIRDVIATIVREAGGLDILFNVAGTNLPKDVENTEDEEWYAILDVNLTSVYRCCKHAVPEMRKRDGGAIVNIASIAGIMGEGNCAAYSASKGGVVMLTRNMAMDLAKYGIRVNAVCPAGAMTPRIEKYMRDSPGLEQQMLALRPIGRFADPLEIARPSLFLASAEASYVTGASLVVDGGLTAGFRVPVLDKAASRMAPHQGASDE
jgi:NAD(P)-dependent dehydrogenase (short-subunit alcohol dehydrogenase family)